MLLHAIDKNSLQGKRILVTGASGFIGASLVEKFLAADAMVCAVSRTKGRLSEIAGQERCEFVSCDLTRETETTRLFEKFAPQIVFHFASHPDGRECYAQARRAIETNLLGTLNTLEGFRLMGDAAELFVYGDTSKVYGDGEVPYRAGMPIKPLSSYAIAKASGWQLCQLYERLYNTPSVAVRPTLIYGPRQSFNLISFVIECVLGGKKEVTLDGGSQTRDPLFIEDALEAFFAVAFHNRTLAGNVINIGGNSECSVSEIAEMIVELMGARTPVVSIEHGVRPTDTRRSYCDNHEAAQLINWRPRTSLLKGLRLTIEYLLDARRNDPVTAINAPFNPASHVVSTAALQLSNTPAHAELSNINLEPMTGNENYVARRKVS